MIGRITADGTIATFPLPTPGASPGGITLGPEGALWFTENGAGKIGRITTSGAVAEFALPSPGSLMSVPNDIVPGPNGALWFTELRANKIGRITTQGTITEFALPPADTFPGRHVPRQSHCGARWRALVHRRSEHPRIHRTHHAQRGGERLSRTDGELPATH
jgi:streptogramin lyase